MNVNMVHCFNPILPFYGASRLGKLCGECRENNDPGQCDKKKRRSRKEDIRQWMREFQNIKLSDLTLIATLGIGGFGR